MPAEIRTTHCVLDCPDVCKLEVEVDDGRVVKIGASDGHPTTNGFICGKVANFDRRLYHEDRLLHPLRRVGAKGEGVFERIGWDEAIRTIATRFAAIRDEWGSEAILPYHYGGSNGLLSDDLVDELLFARLGASRLEKTICAAPTTQVALGMYGKMPGVAFEDYVHAKAVLIWGANPKASNIHLVPFLREAKRNGAFVATIDPRRNFSDSEIDAHLPVRPGTDLPLALAMIHRSAEEGWIDTDFLAAHADGVESLLRAAEDWPVERAAERCGLAPDDIRRVTDVFAASSPAVVRCGWGLERNRNGGQAVAAVLALPAVLGKFGRRGGGYTLSNSGGAKLDRPSLIGADPWTSRRLDMTKLGRWLTDPDLSPPVKGLFVYNANPVVTVPEQKTILEGLAREDLFTVVFEQVRTDTVPWADIVLPATTFFEGRDIRIGYGSYVVGGAAPVIEPAGEARTNMSVFAALGREMGFSDEAFGWDDATLMEKAAAALSVGGRSVDVGRIAAGEHERYDFPGPTPIQFETTGPLTEGGRIHLAPPVLGPHPYEFRELDSDGYPLALISPASGRLVTSTFGEFNLETLEASIHPGDAAARGIVSGDSVRVFNDRGEVVCRARVTGNVRPGVVSMPKGAWRKASQNGLTSTALCPDDTQVVANGACFNDARVEMAPA